VVFFELVPVYRDCVGGGKLAAMAKEEEKNNTEEQQSNTEDKQTIAEEQQSNTEDKQTIAEEQQSITEDKQTIAEEQQSITEDRESIIEGDTSEVSSEDELLAGQAHEELSEQDVFAGDEDFYGLLEDSARQPQGLISYKRFSTLQKILIVSIVVVSAILVFSLLGSPLELLTDLKTLLATSIRRRRTPEPPAQVITQVGQQQTQKLQTLLPPGHPLSLKVAQDLYLQKDYDKAYAAYNSLHQAVPTGDEGQLLRDFLQLRMALCMKQAADSEQAERLFRTILQSRSPVVRVAANYNLGLLKLKTKQYLKARTRAYQTLALIGAVNFDKEWAFALQRDCFFLIAESMTKNILSLCDADADLPKELWSPPLADYDPFAGLNETQLRSFLNSGLEQLDKSVLGPQIRRLDNEGAVPRWSVICRGASIEELLARFAANAGLDISWAFGNTPDSERVEDTVRQRAVSMYMPAATAQEIVTVAAGHAGLLANLDEKGVVNVFNPADYSSLSEHTSLLGRETASLWQRFLLVFHSDRRIPNAHFALALVRVLRGQTSEAIAEYKLVANRFSQKSLAAYALLNSSRLKTDLLDYSGAREDLEMLVEQYPDDEFYGRACLYLADATMKDGRLPEAARLYGKVYNLGLSSQLRTASALGAGRCFSEEKDYVSAAKWLTRYIDLAGHSKDNQLYLAYFLLGKAGLALDKPQQACDAFQCALAGRLSREEYLQTILALVGARMEQEQFVKALDLLENLNSRRLSQEESVAILLLKAGILRSMGLIDKTIMTLGDRAQYITDKQLKAGISLELCNCYIAKGNLERARKSLAEILVVVEPGPLAHQVALKLAEVCLKLDQNPQVVFVCLQLLDLSPSEQIKQKALVLLATAYNRQKKYDLAALALLGRWKSGQTPGEERALGSPVPQAEKLAKAR